MKIIVINGDRLMVFWAAFFLWSGIFFWGLVAFSITLILSAFITEAFNALRFALKIRAAEIVVHGQQKNSLFRIWWYVYASKGEVTVFDKETGKSFEVIRKPKK